MPQVAKSIYLSVNSSDLSSYVREAKLEAGAESVDVSALDGTGVQKFIAGLKTYTLTVEFYQDFANVDSVLYPLLGADPFNVTFRPSNDPVSPSNPEWSGNFILESYTPVSLRSGEVETISATFRPAGTITRSTS